jgi:hypothetical protein
MGSSLHSRDYSQPHMDSFMLVQFKSLPWGNRNSFLRSWEGQSSEVAKTMSRQRESDQVILANLFGVKRDGFNLFPDPKRAVVRSQMTPLLPLSSIQVWSRPKRREILFRIPVSRSQQRNQIRLIHHLVFSPPRLPTLDLPTNRPSQL